MTHRELATVIAKAAAKSNPPEYYTGDTFTPHAWVVDAVEQALTADRAQPDATTVAAGDRCPRCQYIAPNLFGCVRCNPGPLQERLEASLVTVEEQKEEIRQLEAEVRELQAALREQGAAK